MLILDSPSELVHSIFRSIEVISELDFKYFINFLDDYSRVTWLFLMTNRYNFSFIFQKFCTEIKNQFGASIRVLRPDNMKELFSSLFIDFVSI